MKTRRAVTYLSVQDFEQMLHLPEGSNVFSVHDAFPRPGVLVVVEADWLPELPEHVSPPPLHATVARADCGHLRIVDWSDPNDE